MPSGRVATQGLEGCSQIAVDIIVQESQGAGVDPVGVGGLD